MTIGLSTYSFFWQWHRTASRPLRLPDLIAKTAGWGVTLLQICDYPAVESLTDDELDRLGATARRAGVALELGTRGVEEPHLQRYLQLAQRLDVHLVRSMIKSPETDGAIDELRRVVPAYERAGVSLALETYEQLPTRRLVDVVTAVGSPAVGICLDPANCVAALETPRSTVELTADHTLNLHVKDFTFARRADWVGFTFAGARLGEGQLDVDHLMATVRPDERGINKIIEHWLVWQGDSDTTRQLEDEWTLHNLQFLREGEERARSASSLSSAQPLPTDQARPTH